MAPGVQHPAALPTPDPLAALYPLFGLVLRAPHPDGMVTLRMFRDADFPAYAELLRKPIFADMSAPHVFPWYDMPEQQRIRNAVTFQWTQRGECGRDRWYLNFGVWLGDQLVGAQTVEASDFAVRRVVGSGSWLTCDAQGRGLGSLMRRMVVAFAFDHLGAERAESAAVQGNSASEHTSAAVGYQPNGTGVVTIKGERRVELRFVVTPQTFRRAGMELEVTGLTPDLLSVLGAASDEPTSEPARELTTGPAPS